MQPRAVVPRLLSIAGSDSGGGAGIQADIKTASALGVFAATAITAVTAQNTREVIAVEALSPEMVRAQIAAVLGDIGADAIKIGMLANTGIIEAVTDALDAAHVPIVLDPVMVATSGGLLLDESAVESLRSKLLPAATVVTPNLPELDVLAGLKQPTREERLAFTAGLAEANDQAILLKDGHGSGPVVEDALVMPDGVTFFSSERLITTNTHGTGCTLSTAIACGLACGKSLEEAVQAARDFVHAGICSAPELGSGHGPLNFLQ